MVPEFLQRDCTPEQLADAIVPLLHETSERRRQLGAFSRLDQIMDLSGEPPSTRAARAVLALIERKLRGNERAAPLPRFNHQYRMAQATDNTITRREITSIGRNA